MKYHHTFWNAYFQKDEDIINAGEDVNKRDPRARLVGMEIGAATMENSMRVPQKIINRLLSDLFLFLIDKIAFKYLSF